MTKSSAFALLIGSIVAAIALVVMAPKWADWLGSSFDPQAPQQVDVAKVALAEGMVERLPYLANTSSRLSKEDTIAHLDRIEIPARASLAVDVRDYKLKLLGPAYVVFELWLNQQPQGPVVIHVISGQIEVEKEGTRGQVYVLKDSELLDPKGASVQKLTQLIISSTASVAATPAVSLSAAPALAHEQEPHDAQSLSNEYLDQKIAAYSDQFQRCQANALRDGGSVRGQILIGLTITTEGKVSEARALSTTIQNEQLQSCVVEVFRRMKFSSFRGADIVRSYPINFE